MSKVLEIIQNPDSLILPNFKSSHREDASLLLLSCAISKASRRSFNIVLFPKLAKGLAKIEDTEMKQLVESFLDACGITKNIFAFASALWQEVVSLVCFQFFQAVMVFDPQGRPPITAGN